MTKCISVTDSWEKKQAKVAEGPSVLKRGDTYYLIYSANHYESKDYAVGYATSTSPKGPWKNIVEIRFFEEIRRLLSLWG